jgi:hypothetical protein
VHPAFRHTLRLVSYMATLHSSSGPSSGSRDGPFRVSTREISADFSTVGPDQSPGELGVLSHSAFAVLIDKFANIPAVKLIDGDPQLVVSAKRGRFLVLPSTGRLLVRPANDAQQPYVKYAPDELPGFLDSADGQPSTPPPAPAKNLPTPIGSPATVAARTEATIPPTPPPASAPIYGSFPSDLTVRPPATGVTVPSIPASATLPPIPPAPQPKKINRGLVIAIVALFVLTAAGSGWILYRPVPPPPPHIVTSTEFDVTSLVDLASLKKRFVGTYATNGETGGERLLELRPDGTFKYQEFGDGVARTANRTGTYTFALHHGTTKPLIRASDLGTIDIRDEKTLYTQQAVFTKLP